MAKINVLSEEVATKIAAGEVIERPASVVKELVENSLDAGATLVSIEIKQGGKKLIRVADNGCGIEKDDLRVAFMRHSTSKITSIEDLDCLTNFGFRGEALPSIASVSEVSLISRTGGNNSGREINISYGKIKNEKDVGCAVGTIMTVKNLFSTTPARLKFLKSDWTEANHIVRIVTELALSNHFVGISLILNEKESISLSKGDDIKNRISYLFGTEILKEMLAVELKNNLTIYGYISKPEFVATGKPNQYIFVNKRPIRSRLINHAVYEGFREFLSSGKHPEFFLFIEINPKFIDVNVHPTKREIKFSNEVGIHSIVYKLIKERITTKEAIPDFKLKERVGEKIQKYFTEEQNEFFKETKYKYTKPYSREVKDDELDISPVFQFENLYIVARASDSIYIIDQHSAQERVLYEKLSKTKPETQVLLVPFNIEFSPEKYNCIEENLNIFFELGWELDKSGRNSFIVKSIPTPLNQKKAKDIISEIIDSISDEYNLKKINSTDQIREKIILSACKSAVKKNDSLSDIEMRVLIFDLEKCEDPYTCPHGRPTIIKITREELDKKFKRT